WTSLGPAALGKKAVRATAQAVVLIGEMTWWLTQNPAVVYDNLSGPVGIVNTGARLAATSTPHPLPTTAAVPRSEAPRIDTMSPRKAGGGPFHWPRPPELRGYALLVLYMGVLSVFLAFVNLLPLPPFDGYHAAVSALELLLRRPVPARLRAGLAIAGALLFLGLVARGTVNDVTRIRTGAPPVETAARS
ncbi:MAG TPA: site-2 protease family protein, partial [Gemmatimonadaceae bacterium]